jgi:hypothetical protein
MRVIIQVQCTTDDYTVYNSTQLLAPSFNIIIITIIGNYNALYLGN